MPRKEPAATVCMPSAVKKVEPTINSAALNANASALRSLLPRNSMAMS
jgi:hypothetical protein